MRTCTRHVTRATLVGSVLHTSCAALLTALRLVCAEQWRHMLGRSQCASQVHMTQSAASLPVICTNPTVWLLWVADDTILPMNYTHYAIVMRGYAENIRDIPSRSGGIQDAPTMTCPCDQAVTRSGVCPRDTSATASGDAAACPIGKCRHIFADRCPNSQVTMEPVLNALNEMLRVTETVEQDRERLSQPGNTETVAQRDLNDRLVLAERALCTREGLRDRPWFKHLVTLHITPLLLTAFLCP